MGPGSNMIASHDNAGIASWRFNLKAEIGSYEDCERAMDKLDDGYGFAKIGPRMTLIHEGHDMDSPFVVYVDGLPETGFEHDTREDAEDEASLVREQVADPSLVMVKQTSRTYAVELYHTKIIRYYPDGTFSVSNGGYATPTTRERLQAVLPDGFLAYHHSTPYLKRKLGLEKLSQDGSRTFPTRGKTQPDHVLWPLDHSVRIDAKTGRRVETGGAS